MSHKWPRKYHQRYHRTVFEQIQDQRVPNDPYGALGLVSDNRALFNLSEGETLTALELVFQRLDAFTLAKAAQVCRYWHRLARDNRLWNELVYRRFGLRKNANLRVLGMDSWAQLYKEWSIDCRMPLHIRGKGSDGVSFARGCNRSRSVFVWATVNHTANCQLRSIPDDPGRAYISIVVVLQNTLAEAVYFHLEDIWLKRKDDQYIEPFLFDGKSCGSVTHHALGPKVFVAKIAQYITMTESQLQKGIRLDYMQPQCVLMNFPVYDSAYEAQALDHFSRFGVYVCFKDPRFTVDEMEGLPLEASIDGERKDLLVADFREKVIFDHYTRLPGDFWVFNEHANQGE
eukprot:Clim_evm25s167 gene=Clim_evmTU25s167